jgi:hypothetical protein
VLLLTGLLLTFFPKFSLGGRGISFLYRVTFWIILVQHLNMIHKNIHLIEDYNFVTSFLTHSIGPDFNAQGYLVTMIIITITLHLLILSVELISITYDLKQKHQPCFIVSKSRVIINLINAKWYYIFSFCSLWILQTGSLLLKFKQLWNGQEI